MLNMDFNDLKKQFADIADSRLEENEINNLIYSLVRFGFRKIDKRLDDPPNTLIHEIMVDVVDERTIPAVIDNTVRIVIKDYNIRLTDVQVTGVKEHLKYITVLFMNEPYESRIDLGADSESEDFVTKH